MTNQYTYRKLEFCKLGLIDYKIAWDLQKKLHAQRYAGEIEDTLLLLEHPHTYTLGKAANRKNLISSDEYLRENKINVYNIDRGGDITYHGPGQIVGYAILNLSNWKKDTHVYLRTLEEVIIRTCADYGLKTGRIEGYTGVWIEERKICAIGIKVSRWITMHGFAFNVKTDLSLFNGIIPCGIDDKEVTSLERELGKKINLVEVQDKIKKHFADLFGYDKIIEKYKNEYINEEVSI